MNRLYLTTEDKLNHYAIIGGQTYAIDWNGDFFKIRPKTISSMRYCRTTIRNGRDLWGFCLKIIR